LENSPTVFPILSDISSPQHHFLFLLRILNLLKCLEFSVKTQHRLRNCHSTLDSCLIYDKNSSLPSEKSTTEVYFEVSQSSIHHTCYHNYCNVIGNYSLDSSVFKNARQTYFAQLLQLIIFRINVCYLKITVLVSRYIFSILCYTPVLPVS
jgi:hypothetical protein